MVSILTSFGDFVKKIKSPGYLFFKKDTFRATCSWGTAYLVQVNRYLRDWPKTFLHIFCYFLLDIQLFFLYFATKADFLSERLLRFQEISRFEGSILASFRVFIVGERREHVP